MQADDPHSAYVFDGTVSTKVIDLDLPIPVARIAGMQAILHTAGVMPKTVEVASLVESSLREKAHRLVER